MSFERYRKFKEDGIRTYAKAPWVWDWYESIDMDYNQWNLLKKLETRLVTAISICFLAMGMLLGLILG